MAVFSTTPPAYQTSSPGTAAAVQIWSGTGVTVSGTAYPFTAGVTFSNLVIQNSGAGTACVGAGSTVTAATGFPIPPGDSVVFQASVAEGATSVFNLWAIASGAATTLETSLASVDAVI